MNVQRSISFEGKFIHMLIMRDLQELPESYQIKSIKFNDEHCIRLPNDCGFMATISCFEGEEATVDFSEI